MVDMPHGIDVWFSEHIMRPVLLLLQGTAITEAREFYEVYGLNVVEVPSRLPNIRIDHAPRLFTHRVDRLVSLYLIVMEAHQRGRPVLIGTASVAESEQIDILLHEPKHFLMETDDLTGTQARKCLTIDRDFHENMHQCTLNKAWSPFRYALVRKEKSVLEGFSPAMRHGQWDALHRTTAS